MIDLRFTEEHEWVRLGDDGNITIGITDYAQEQLGDVVFVELPEVGTVFSQGDEAAVVESVKAAGDIKCPVAGEVIEINEKLTDEPELANSDPTDGGWFFIMKPDNPDDINTLMDEDAYTEFLTGL